MKQTEEEARLDQRDAEREEDFKGKLNTNIKDMEDRFYQLKGQDPGKTLP